MTISAFYSPNQSLGRQLAAAMIGLRGRPDTPKLTGPSIYLNRAGRRNDDRRSDKEKAAEYGIPKAFVRNAKAGGSDVDGIISHYKIYADALTLDEAAAKRRADRAAA